MPAIPSAATPGNPAPGGPCSIRLRNGLSRIGAPLAARSGIGARRGDTLPGIGWYRLERRHDCAKGQGIGARPVKFGPPRPPLFFRSPRNRGAHGPASRGSAARPRGDRLPGLEVITSPAIATPSKFARRHRIGVPIDAPHRIPGSSTIRLTGPRSLRFRKRTTRCQLYKRGPILGSFAYLEIG